MINRSISCNKVVSSTYSTFVDFLKAPHLQPTALRPGGLSSSLEADLLHRRPREAGTAADFARAPWMGSEAKGVQRQVVFFRHNSGEFTHDDPQDMVALEALRTSFTCFYDMHFLSSLIAPAILSTARPLSLALFKAKLKLGSATSELHRNSSRQVLFFW